MKLSKIVKDYLKKEIIKETASGQRYRQIDDKAVKITHEQTPDNAIVICNGPGCYGGYIRWYLWVKDPQNRWIDVYNINANAVIRNKWNISLNYISDLGSIPTTRNNENVFIGVRHYSDKTSINIFYHTGTKNLNGAKRRSNYWEKKQPIEFYDKNPSERDKDAVGIRDFYDFQITPEQKGVEIWSPKSNDNQSDKEFAPTIKQMIEDVYDLNTFKKAYPQGIRVPRDFINFLKMSDSDIARRVKIQKKNGDCFAEYKETAAKIADPADTAIRIGDIIYYNYQNHDLYVKNLKNNTLVCYADFEYNPSKSPIQKRGIECWNDSIESDTNDKFQGCYNAQGEQISLGECFGERSNVISYFEYFDMPKNSRVVLQLFAIRDEYAKILELAIKSKHQYLTNQILMRNLLCREPYDKKTTWGQCWFLRFDQSKNNLSQMLGIGKFALNQIKNFSPIYDLEDLAIYLKLSKLFNNLTLTEFTHIYRSEVKYSLLSNEINDILTKFAQDGLETFKKRLFLYGASLSIYRDYLRMIEQMKQLASIDSTVQFIPNEWPLYPEAAVKHVTIYYTPNAYWNLGTISNAVTNHMRYTLRCSDYTILSKTNEQAIVEARLTPEQHLFYLHDELVKIYNIYQDKVRNEAFKQSIKRLKAYEFTDGVLSIVAPKTAQDLTTEGAVLHHCVGSFINAVTNNRENVLFIRRNDMLNEPYYTMAVSPSGIIEQVHCTNNGGLSKEEQTSAYGRSKREVYNQTYDLVAFLKKWASTMRKQGISIDPTTVRDNYRMLGARN